MKKLKYLILLLLLFPITVCAKTPNKDETIKVIESIENVQVDDGIIIYNVDVDNNKMILNLSDNGNTTQKEINYYFDDKGLTFKGGNFIVDKNTKELTIKESNDYAFYLYSILENKSSVPYNIDNYYNNTNIIEKAKVLTENERVYIEDTNTFGITLKKEVVDNSEYINIYYNYYYTGDYPVMIKEEVTEELKNPETGNYSIIITVILIITIGIGIYTYFEPDKRIKGE